MAVYEKWATIKYGTLTVGKNDHGHDVKLYGATSGKYLLWDEDADSLLLLGTFAPATSDGAPLGSTSLMWSDLFLASGGVINFNNGDVTMTHGTSKTLDIASTWSTAAVADEMFSVTLTTNVSLGSYANAFYAKVDCQSVGGATGLLSAGCLEIVSPTTGIAGTTAALELEMGYGATCGALQKPCFIYAATYGTAKTDFDTYGDFVTFGDGLTAGTGKMVGAGTSTLRIGTGALGQVHRYIPLSTAEASYTTAYPIVSTSTTGFSSNPTLVPDSTRTNYAFAMGLSSAHTSATALTVTIGSGSNQNLDPIQLNLLVAGVNPGNTSTLNASYMLITHSTAMANMRLKCADWNVAVSANVRDAYVFQGEIDVTGPLTLSGEICAVGLVVNVGTGAITGGSVEGIRLSMDGAYMPAASYGFFIATGSGATLTHAIYIETQNGTVITNGMRFGNAATGTFTNLISVGGTVVNFLNLANAGNSGFVTTGDKGATVDYTLKVIAPDGAARYIKLYSAA